MIETAEDLCDVARLIRSIQRLEGNPDCFGAARDSCEQTLCAWRQYCLKLPRRPTAADREDNEG
jgi:hypothetical protein